MSSFSSGCLQFACEECGYVATTWRALAEVLRSEGWPTPLNELRRRAYWACPPARRLASVQRSTLLSLEAWRTRWGEGPEVVRPFVSRLQTWASHGGTHHEAWSISYGLGFKEHDVHVSTTKERYAELYDTYRKARWPSSDAVAKFTALGWHALAACRSLEEIADFCLRSSSFDGETGFLTQYLKDNTSFVEDPVRESDDDYALRCNTDGARTASLAAGYVASLLRPLDPDSAEKADWESLLYAVDLADSLP